MHRYPVPTPGGYWPCNYSGVLLPAHANDNPSVPDLSVYYDETLQILLKDYAPYLTENEYEELRQMDGKPWLPPSQRARLSVLARIVTDPCDRGARW